MKRKRLCGRLKENGRIILKQIVKEQNESLDWIQHSINRGKMFGQLGYYQLLNKDCVPWNFPTIVTHYRHNFVNTETNSVRLFSCLISHHLVLSIFVKLTIGLNVCAVHTNLTSFQVTSLPRATTCLPSYTRQLNPQNKSRNAKTNKRIFSWVKGNTRVLKLGVTFLRRYFPTVNLASCLIFITAL